MKTVIEMAKECGFVTGPYGIGVPPSRISINDTTDAPWMLEALERFAELVRTEEREACAKVCEEYDGSWYAHRKGAQECAAAIRARSNT